MTSQQMQWPRSMPTVCWTRVIRLMMARMRTPTPRVPLSKTRTGMLLKTGIGTGTTKSPRKSLVPEAMDVRDAVIEAVRVTLDLGVRRSDRRRENPR